MAFITRFMSPDWTGGDDLAAADLSAEFNTIHNALKDGTIDVNVNEITANGNVTVDAEMTVEGNVTLNANVTFSANTVLNVATITTSGNLTSEGDTLLNANAQVSGTLDVNGATTLAALNVTDLGASGNITVTGNSSVTGDSNVTGNVIVTGNTNVTSDLGVTGNISIGGTLLSSLTPTASTLALGGSAAGFTKLYVDNGSTDGGAVYFNNSDTSFIKSSADGLTLDLSGFTAITVDSGTTIDGTDISAVPAWNPCYFELRVAAEAVDVGTANVMVYVANVNAATYSNHWTVSNAVIKNYTAIANNATKCQYTVAAHGLSNADTIMVLGDPNKSHWGIQTITNVHNVNAFTTDATYEANASNTLYRPVQIVGNGDEAGTFKIEYTGTTNVAASIDLYDGTTALNVYSASGYSATPATHTFVNVTANSKIALAATGSGDRTITTLVVTGYRMG